jgi:hypothetical protein
MPSKVVSHAADACSTLLSRESSPPIDDVIAAGIVPQLAKFLYRHDSPALQYEAAWTLTNISSGTHEQTASVVESGAVPQVSFVGAEQVLNCNVFLSCSIFQLVQMLTSENEDLREQCLWALGNIAGDGCELRDALLSMDVLNGVLMLLNSSPKVCFRIVELPFVRPSDDCCRTVVHGSYCHMDDFQPLPRKEAIP